MTCAQCLAELATGSLRELPPDSAVMLHCARCPDCARLTTLLRDREYNAASALNTLPPLSNPVSVAETAGRLSRRRRVGSLVVMLSGAALVVTIWTAAATTIIPMMNDAEKDSRSALRTETIPLSCLSPQQAADIINPYVRGGGSTYWLPSSGISAITVRGTAAELVRSRHLIRDFENDPHAACHNSRAMTPQKARDKPSEVEGVTANGPAGRAPHGSGPIGGAPRK